MLKYIISFISAVAIASTGFISFKFGVESGIDSYHKQCYNFGGFIIRNEQVIHCQPLGTISKEEQQQFDEVKKNLDKLNKV